MDIYWFSWQLQLSLSKNEDEKPLSALPNLSSHQVSSGPK